MANPISLAIPPALSYKHRFCAPLWEGCAEVNGIWSEDHARLDTR